MFVIMELTKKQKAVKTRRDYAGAAYKNKGEQAVSAVVKAIADKFNVTDITIYADLKALGLTKNK